MGLTRRQFIQRTGLATAGSFLGSAFGDNVFVRQALADALGDRYLVILFLDGGNDGLNTVTPIANGASGTLRTIYQNVRGTGGNGLQLSSGELLPIGNDPNTNTPLGLHPGLSGFKSLWDDNRLAVVQGCGYPDQSLSHATSRGYWETGDRFSALPGKDGWMGRYLINAGFGPADNTAVNVRSSLAGEFIQTVTGILAFTNLSKFGFPYDTTSQGGGNGDVAFKEAAYQALHAAASAAATPRVKFIGDVGQATLTASSVYPDLVDFYAGIDGYPNSSTGKDVADIARVIYGVENDFDAAVCARYFELRNGGYDTHSNQGDGSGGRQYDLHVEVGDAVKHLYDDLDSMGIAHKVTTVVWSEFSRRVNQNSSGTDHGSQGPMFIIGDGVNSGVYGNHPDIGDLDNRGNTKYSQDNGNPARSTDFRDVFGTILKHWQNVADPTTVFPVDTIGDPDLYWENPNFDLGFLP